MREDVVDKVLKRDLPALYNIRNATELERIFLYLCNVSSDIVAIDAMAKELNGVSRQTVQNYIEYLESANLIYLSYPVALDGKKILKARPKIYIADAAIRNAVLMDNDAIVEHCDKAVAAIIITKRADDFGEHTSGNGKKLLRIPAFAFLYLLGHAEKHGYKGIK